MVSGVCSTNGWRGRTAEHFERVGQAAVVRSIGPVQNELHEVQPKKMWVHESSYKNRCQITQL